MRNNENKTNRSAPGKKGAKKPPKIGAEIAHALAVRLQELYLFYKWLLHIKGRNADVIFCAQDVIQGDHSKTLTPKERDEVYKFLDYCRKVSDGVTFKMEFVEHLLNDLGYKVK